MQSFKNLKVWSEAHVLTLDVYKISRPFPRDELFGLTSQMRQASASELEYHPLAHDLELLKALDYERLSGEVIEIKRMQASLIHKRRAHSQERSADLSNLLPPAHSC